MFIPVYSLYSFLCVVFASKQVSLTPWQQLVEAFAMGNFFLLLLELISPHEDQRSLFFAGIDLPGLADTFSMGKKKKPKTAKPKKATDVLAWYRRKWIAVWQFVLVSIMVGIVTDVTEALGKFCDSSYNPKFAHVWMVVVQNVSEAVAITTIILTFMATRKQLASHRPLAKLGAFKGIIFVTFSTGILFTILQSTGAMKPNKYLNYADIKVGIPTLTIVLLMVPFSIFFHYAYAYKFYVIGASHSLESGKIDIPGYRASYQGGFLGLNAYLAALNPLETISAIVFSFKLYNPASKDYVRRRMEGPNGEAYAINPKTTSRSSSNRPGFEPLRPAGNSADDYDTSCNQPMGGYVQPGGYHAVANSGAQEQGSPMGYAGYNAAPGRDVGPPSRSHGRNPSREQFFAPGVDSERRSHSVGRVGEPVAFGPLNDRERY